MPVVRTDLIDEIDQIRGGRRIVQVITAPGLLLTSTTDSAENVGSPTISVDSADSLVGP
jgi:hypothetical protein